MQFLTGLSQKNVNKLQGFIRFQNFYQQFIDHLSKTTVPLPDLKKTHTPSIWSKSCDKAFGCMRKVVILAPILKIADLYSHPWLKYNHLEATLGSVLSQKFEEESEMNPVASQ